MSTIFISYEHSDRPIAELLAGVLQQHGWSVWWDIEISPGKSYDEVIESAIDRAHCVVVLWSKASVRSRWVRLEASEGFNRGILLPALIEDGVKIPLEFRKIEAARLIGWDGDPDHREFDALRSAIAELLGGELVDPDLAVPVTTSANSARARLSPASKSEDVYVDERTGLMWTVRDNGENITWTQGQEYADDLRLGGFSDWRLPIIEELQPLYDAESGNENNVRPPFQLSSWIIWSSTPLAGGGELVQTFLFNRGFPYFSGRNGFDGCRVLCVRDPRHPRPRDSRSKRGKIPQYPGFHTLSNDHCIDRERRLMWTTRDSGKDVTWDRANQYADTLQVGGFSDWRLPTIEELEQIYVPAAGKNLNARPPIRITSWWVWSATRARAGWVWGFDFYYGKRAEINADDDPATSWVLCVRSVDG